MGGQAKSDKIGQGRLGRLAKIGHPIFWDSCHLKKITIDFFMKFILKPILKPNSNYITNDTFANCIFSAKILETSYEKYLCIYKGGLRVKIGHHKIRA